VGLSLVLVLENVIPQETPATWQEISELGFAPFPWGDAVEMLK
jgi:uncharacterized protein YjeT (DUF2065 family)